MGRIDHKHIVQLIKTKFDPWPKLYLEYAPGGSLEDHMDLSMGECKQVLCQLLSALDHLHGLEPPILHRDIKGQWKTICGTWRYIAPEMFVVMRDRMRSGCTSQRYTAAVDIWSLGIVMFNLVCGIPSYKAEYEYQGTHWAETILEKLGKDLSREPSDLLQFFSTAMLVIEPASQGNKGQVDSEIGFRYQVPPKSVYLGSSLSALERELPPNWNQPLDSDLISGPPGPEPVGYAPDNYPVSIGARQSGGQPVENPPYYLEPPYPGGEDTFFEGTDLGAQGAHDKEADLAALRLAIHRDNYGRAT